MEGADSFNIVILEDNNTFKCTVPASQIRRVNAFPDDYAKLTIVKGSFECQTYFKVPSIPPSRTALQVKVVIPKCFVNEANLKQGDVLSASIRLLDNFRPDQLIISNHLDLLAIIPIKTRTGKSVMVDVFNKNGHDWLKLWYCPGKGGHPALVEIRRFILITRSLGEFFGLMQAESSKTGARFDFTIKFLDVIIFFKEIAELFGIQEFAWRGVIYYAPEIGDKKLCESRAIFAARLNIGGDSIFPVRNKNISDFVYAIYIPNTLLAQVMMRALTFFREYLGAKTELTGCLKEFYAGFIIKYLLGDGTVIPLKNSGLSIFLSEGNLSIHNDIARILRIFNINSSFQGIKIHLSTNFDSCLWLIENKAFAEHRKNRRKLLGYALSNYYYNILLARLILSKEVTASELAIRHGLSLKSAQKYLDNNTARGFFSKKKENKRVLFHVSEKGERFLDLMHSARQEWLALDDSERD